jgi:hypothetical protein
MYLVNYIVIFLLSVLLLGACIPLLLERRIGKRAYLFGWLVPVLGMIVLTIGYFFWARTIPCPPLAVCDGSFYMFIALIILIIFAVIAGVFAQAGAYLVLRALMLTRRALPNRTR